MWDKFWLWIRGKTWCIVRLPLDGSMYVVPMKSVVATEHVVLKNLTRKEGRMWRSMME